MTDEPAANGEQTPRNWKLLLRYGRLKTRYEHFTVFVDVRVTEPQADVRSQLGPAWMAMKVWAPSADAAAEIICHFAPQVGAEVRGKCEVYKSEPDEPPQDTPYAYDLRFTAYKE
jgi:hypothetical protein